MGAVAPVILGIKDFPGTPEAVADARHYVGGLLGGRITEDAELCTSELVTNACKYTRSRSGTVTVVVLDLGRVVRIEVIDEGGAETTPEVRGDLYALTGRGLFLVEQVADRWGTHADDAGRVTWFEVTCR